MRHPFDPDAVFPASSHALQGRFGRLALVVVVDDGGKGRLGRQRLAMTAWRSCDAA
jgi:hypothetical protein